MACIALAGRIHIIGGAIGSEMRRSIDWHLVYDPQADRYERRQPMPVARDHTGIIVVGNNIHLIGGRVDSFHTNSTLHHSYDPRTDAWTFRTPMPTPRSGHGCVLYRGKVFVHGRRRDQPRVRAERGVGSGCGSLGGVCADAHAAAWDGRGRASAMRSMSQAAGRRWAVG